jgi:hypothetical protein
MLGMTDDAQCLVAPTMLRGACHGSVIAVRFRRHGRWPAVILKNLEIL